MALKTDSLLSISSNGVEYDKIGLSKTLNNYTFDELFNSVYCSADSNLIYHVASGGDITYYDYQDSPDNGHIPVKLTPAGQNRSAIYFPNDNPMNIPDGLYFRIIWLQRTRSGYDSYINKDGTGPFYKAITMLDSRHYVWECNPPTKQNNNYGANSWDAEDNLYCSESGALYYYDDIKSANPTRIVVSNIIPAIIFKFNNHNYILPYRQKMSYFFTKDNTHSESSYNPKTAKYCYDYDNSNPIAFPITTEQIYNRFNSSTGEFSSPIAEGSYISLGSSGYPSNGFSNTLKEHVMSIYSFGGNTSYNSYFGFSVYNYFKTKHECIKFWALGGLYIKADKIYKPIIKDGYVSDFTEDLNTESDIDNWTGDTNHKVPDESPGGSGGDDNSDSVDFGGMYGGGGAFSRFYIMDVTELANLRSWMNGVQLEGGDKIPMGLDPMQQIISLSEFPVDISSSGLAPENIIFRTINVPQDAFGPNVPIPATVNTGVSAVRATGGTIELDLGTVEIPRYWQSKEVPFLDYETSIECYIPFCGVFGLDCQTVMGKTLGAKLYLATATGACNCIVYTNTGGTLNPVAYGSGNMSAQLPISSNQWGTLVAATYEQRMSIAQAQSGALGNASSALMGGLVGTVSGVDMSFGEHVLMGQNIFGSVSKTGQNAGSVHIQKQLGRNKLQAIGTTFSGAFGTTAAWSLPFKAYVKITRPNAQIPDNYAHTEGIPQVRTKVLGDCQGLTICINTDVSSINATLQEKNMIVEALSNGVIV